MTISLSRILHDKATSFSSREALRIRDKGITYDELNVRALAVAAALNECGAFRETIGIVGQRKLSSYVGVVAALYAGCHYTPINPKYNEDRILAMLRDAKIRFLIGDRSDLELLEPVLSCGEATSIEVVIVPEGEAPSGKANWRGEGSLRNLTPLARPLESKPEDLAYILYTSGSTGVPKGVQVQNSNILAFLRSMSAIYRLEAGFRASQTFDFSFDPSVSDMFFTWTQGGVLCVLPEEEMLLPHEFIQRERIEYWNSVPAVAGFMNKMGKLKPAVFPDLRYSMFCGEQFPQQLANAWQQAAPNSTVENLYGPTEATIYISRYLYGPSEHAKSFKNSIIPIGRAFLDHEFALIDDAGNRLPSQETGEIVYKGPQITRGYLHDPVKTEAAFVSFPWDHSGSRWYKSGDLGFYNADGNLECIGRKDSQIKLGGRRIEIGEIEAILGRYPETSDAVVVPLRDENQVVTGCVAFTMHQVSKTVERHIREDSIKHLERIFFPKKIITIEVFPVSPSGKKDRKALSALAQQMLSTNT